jgi:hypothetical protein
MTETVLDNLSQAVPMNKLITMRKLSELRPHLPFTVAGLKVEWIDSVRADTAASRQGSFLTVGNTPAMQLMSRPYKPMDIYNYVKKELSLDYDPELREFEGELEKLIEPQGTRNPFHLLEESLIMGPTGDTMKGDPAPELWRLHDEVTDELIRNLRSAIGSRTILPKDGVPSTAGSYSRGLRLSHVLTNSAAEPFFSNPAVGKTSKGFNLQAGFRLASKFMRPGSSFPLWPAVAFARGDRTHSISYFKDTEEALSRVVAETKGRLISGQSFPLQILDGLFTQALSEKLAASPYPAYDMREPWLLSDHFQEGMAQLKDIQGPAMSIGSDESGWDRHVTPQSWYRLFRVYKALFPTTLNIPMMYTDYPVVYTPKVSGMIKRISPGGTATMEVNVLDGEIERMETVEVEMLQVDTDQLLRNIMAGASGSGHRFGNILVSGYVQVLETPKDGRIQVGWSMRSGNWLTFLGNSIMNEGKLEYIGKASRDSVTRTAYKEKFGVEPPSMYLRWRVVRGDDAGQIWEFGDDYRNEKISEVLTNWLTLLGSKANASKQDTSDVIGRWRLGFAQVFTSENYPRGVVSGIRALARNIYREEDETVKVDPDSGEDLRSVLHLMNLYGRTSNIWGLWDRAVHPRAAEITAILQDLETDNRFLPPLDEGERRKAGRAFALKLFRRGQVTDPSQMDSIIKSFWGTDLSEFTMKRYDDNPKLASDWSPITRYGDDARPVWYGQ